MPELEPVTGDSVPVVGGPSGEVAAVVVAGGTVVVVAVPELGEGVARGVREPRGVESVGVATSVDCAAGVSVVRSAAGCSTGADAGAGSDSGSGPGNTVSSARPGVAAGPPVAGTAGSTVVASVVSGAGHDAGAGGDVGVGAAVRLPVLVELTETSPVVAGRVPFRSSSAPPRGVGTSSGTTVSVSVASTRTPARRTVWANPDGPADAAVRALARRSSAREVTRTAAGATGRGGVTGRGGRIVRPWPAPIGPAGGTGGRLCRSVMGSVTAIRRTGEAAG